MKQTSLTRTTSTRLKSQQSISMHQQLSPQRLLQLQKRADHSQDTCSKVVHQKQLAQQLFNSIRTGTPSSKPVHKKKNESHCYFKVPLVKFDAKCSNVSTNDSLQPSFRNDKQLVQTHKKDGVYRFKDYKIEQFLGRGKYSEVYLAVELNTNLQVALKIMKKQLVQSMSKAIAQEIKIQYILKHSNLVKLYTFFQTDTEIVLVMEYCPHGQLFKILRGLPELHFSEEVARRYIRQVAHALQFLHRNGILHRDLKPENIFVSFNQIKLADFTYSVYSPHLERQTQCGSLAYLSPEILRGDSYDSASDMWSLGVLTYELCHGETPWENCSQEDIHLMILKGGIQLPESFSQNLRDFICGLLNPNAKTRLSAKLALLHPWLQNVKQIDCQQQFVC